MKFQIKIFSRTFCLLVILLSGAHLRGEAAEVNVLAALQKGADVWNKYGFDGNEPASRVVTVRQVGDVSSKGALALSIHDLFQSVPTFSATGRLALPVVSASPETKYAAAVLGLQSPSAITPTQAAQSLGTYLTKVQGSDAVANVTSQLGAIEIKLGNQAYRAFVLSFRDPAKFGGSQILELSGLAKVLIYFANLAPTLTQNSYVPCRQSAACTAKVGSEGGFFNATGEYRDLWTQTPNREFQATGGTTSSDCNMSCKVTEKWRRSGEKVTSGKGHRKPGEAIDVPTQTDGRAQFLVWDHSVTRQPMCTGYHEMLPGTAESVCIVNPDCADKTTSYMKIDNIACSEYGFDAKPFPLAPKDQRQFTVAGFVNHHNTEFYKHVPISFFESRQALGTCETMQTEGTAHCVIHNVPENSLVIGNFVGSLIITVGLGVISGGVGALATGTTVLSLVSTSAAGAVSASMADQILPKTSDSVEEILQQTFRGSCKFVKQ